MSTEDNKFKASRSSEEELSKGTLYAVDEVFSIDECSAECQTCHETCTLADGHPGLHHCPNGHEWFA